jgi:hypothetical protein
MRTAAKVYNFPVGVTGETQFCTNDVIQEFVVNIAKLSESINLKLAACSYWAHVPIYRIINYVTSGTEAEVLCSKMLFYLSSEKY